MKSRNKSVRNMIYVELPAMPVRRLPFYLATEEYVECKFDSPEYFFMWQVNPTVILGRNQLIEAEVNLEYCRNHGIETYRRKSGGGCVFADMSNIMFSYITTDTTVRLTFDKYMRIVAHTLRRLGVNAEASGRNDIMIDGRKVSGNAFYHIPGRSIVHGTMLYDTNIENMVGAITPSCEKLVSKGIQSVRQHITLLKDHISLDIEEFKDFTRRNLCNGEIVLYDDAIAQIAHIEEEYLTPEFIYGNNPSYNIIRSGRIEGVGDFVISMEMKNDVIKDIDIKGDFFLVGDIGQQIIAKLQGTAYTADAISAALPQQLDNVILNLKKDDFVSLLMKKTPTDVKKKQ